jgi:hypothetical protein
MALDKKGGFGLNLEEQFKDAPRVTDVKPTDTHTHTDTHTDTAVVKETQSKRTYGTTWPSLHDRVSRYAKANGTSYNDIVNKLLLDFVKEKGV